MSVVGLQTRSSGRRRCKGFFLNCGWGTGGFKAIPAGGWALAHLALRQVGITRFARAPFDLSRFAHGRLIDEAAGAGIAH